MDVFGKRRELLAKKGNKKILIFKYSNLEEAKLLAKKKRNKKIF
jgi:hypothetical protein